MNANLYVVHHQIGGEYHISPVVGEEALRKYAEEAEHFGAQLVKITDVEWELKRFVWDCCFEGLMNGWGWPSAQ